MSAPTKWACTDWMLKPHNSHFQFNNFWRQKTAIFFLFTLPPFMFKIVPNNDDTRLRTKQTIPSTLFCLLIYLFVCLVELFVRRALFYLRLPLNSLSPICPGIFCETSIAWTTESKPNKEETSRSVKLSLQNKKDVFWFVQRSKEDVYTCGFSHTFLKRITKNAEH